MFYAEKIMEHILIIKELEYQEKKFSKNVYLQQEVKKKLNQI